MRAASGSCKALTPSLARSLRSRPTDPAARRRRRPRLPRRRRSIRPAPSHLRGAVRLQLAHDQAMSGMEQQQVREASAVGLDRRSPAVLGPGRSEVSDAPAEQARTGDDGALEVSFPHGRFAGSKEADQASRRRATSKSAGSGSPRLPTVRAVRRSRRSLGRLPPGWLLCAISTLVEGSSRKMNGDWDELIRERCAQGRNPFLGR
jgi:hypothetical protein